jgi:chorismate mutase
MTLPTGIRPTGTAPQESHGPRTARATGETDALIAAKRRRIDELDAALVALVRERMAVSGEIQAARLGGGGRRIHLAREMEVLRAYGAALGRPGTALGMTLLELCRGRA